MLKEQLKRISFVLANEKESNIDWFKYLFSLMNSTEIQEEEKEENTVEFCNCFWNTSICMKYMPEEWDEQLISELKKYVVRLKISTENIKDEKIYRDKRIVLIRFLDALIVQEDKLFDGNLGEDFAEFYGCMNDVIDKLAWLFQIKVGCEHLFPIQKLLNEVIESSANPTKDNLIQLIFSLQLFNKIKVSDEEDIRKRIIDISDKYHIEILKVLCSGGTLLFGDFAGANSTNNSVLVAKDNRNIVIRSTNVNYFGVSEDVIEELNGNGVLIGKCIKKEIKDNWEFMSISDVLKGTNKNAIYSLLENVYESGIFNCFMPEAIIVDKYDKSFLGFTNDFSYNDKVIVLENDISNKCDSESFWNVIQNEQNGIRGVRLVENRNRSNIITLDFMATFYNETKENDVTYISKLRNLNEDSFYQNQIFKLYFDKKTEKGEFKDAVIRYEQLVKKYINVLEMNESSPMTQISRLIMPYKIFLPYNGNVEEMYKDLIEKKYFGSAIEGDLKKGIIKLGKRNRKYLEIDGEIIEKEKIERLEDYKPLEFSENEYWLIKCSTTDKYLLLEELVNVERKMHNLNEFSSQMSIVEDVILEDINFGKLSSIIYHIGFNSNLLKIYGMSKRCKDISLATFKLLWHMQVYCDDDFAKWFGAFKKLYLEKFYIKYVLDPQKYDKLFVDQIESECDGKTLFIAKESSGERSTLHTIVEEYVQDRGPIKWAFDAGKLNSEIVFDNKGYKFVKTNNYIERIVFLTDNILSGGSTNLMIEYYIDKDKCQKREEAEKRSFLKLPFTFEHLLHVNKKVLNKDVDVKVKCIFAEDRGIKKVEQKWSTIGLQVDPIDTIQFLQYHVDEEVKFLLDKLYGSDEPSDRFTCIFRAHNMPNNVILSENLVDIDKVGGIYKRDPEE